MHDSIGPEHIVEVYDPAVGMRGFLVIDNTTRGLGKGGVRMTPEVSREEVFRLARAMTFKNALSDIPFGGAKAGIVADAHKLNKEEKERVVRSFARAIAPFVPNQYITGPDMSMGEDEMVWVADELGVWEAATGKPSDYCEGGRCGLPHELGSTGFGVAHAARVATAFLEKDIADMQITIAGFGNVGQYAAQFLNKMGARIVGVSDSRGAVVDKGGLAVEELIAHKKDRKSVVDYGGGEVLTSDELYAYPTDILIPAAGTDVIGQHNIDEISARIIVEGSNIPMQEQYEEILHKNEVLVVPDIIANAGGVISSYAEVAGMGEEEMFRLVETKITQNVQHVLDRVAADEVLPRTAAVAIAQERI